MDSATGNHPAAPHWLDELPRRILERFVDSLDKGHHQPRIRISERSAPELYRFDDVDFVNIQWELLNSLAKEYEIISIHCKPSKAGQVIYEQASIRFNPEKEDLVRHWLNRPRVDAYTQSWRATLAKLANQFEDQGQALHNNLVHCGRDAEQLLSAFASISQQLEHPLTLRALSARCFWGDSKFLDNKEAVVRALYPSRSRNLLDRPVLMNVSLPDTFHEVIFVENQDSFIALSERKLDGQAVVYSAGFRGSAQRVRERGSVIFSYLHQSDLTTVADFEGWWFSRQLQVPCYFWGDLDFSGMAILKALRNTFSTIEAWRPGYTPLLDQLIAGGGHSAEEANKKQQIDPVTTGCHFADDVLLPQMRKHGFVDQESVLPVSLKVSPPRAHRIIPPKRS